MRYVDRDTTYDTFSNRISGKIKDIIFTHDEIENMNEIRMITCIYLAILLRIFFYGTLYVTLIM